MTTCETCGLILKDEVFHPKVGKPFNSSTAFNLVCQYSGTKPCLNKGGQLDPNADSWEKRLKKDPWETNFLK